MRGLKTWASAAVIAAATASPAFAQMTGGTTTGTTRATGGITSGGTTGGNTLGGGNTGGGSSLGGNNNPQMDVQPTIAKPIGTSASSLQASNAFAGFYANPYFQGKDFYTKSAAPGGFGMPLYGTTGTAAAGGRGAAGGLGAGGRGGQTASNQSGIVIPLPVPISYTATMRFATPPVPAAKLQADLRGIIDAGGIATPKSVQVIANGTDITLRGTVKDDEEARLVEGLVRLTPGVGNITNELTFPVASK